MKALEEREEALRAQIRLGEELAEEYLKIIDRQRSRIETLEARR